jgi:hypothetical protein
MRVIILTLGIMKNTKKWMLKSSKRILKYRKPILGLVILSALIVIGNLMLSKPYEDYYKKLSGINMFHKAEPNEYLSRVDYQDYISQQITTLHEKGALKVAELNTRQQIIWQMRTIYLGILAGLVAVLFKAKRKNKFWLAISILGLIVANYFLDVHLDDIYKRNDDTRAHIHGTIYYLVSQTSQDTLQYRVDATEYGIQYRDGFSNKPLLYKRKLYVASNFWGSNERILYYVIPFIILYISMFFGKAKHK